MTTATKHVHAYLDPPAYSALLRLQARNRAADGTQESQSSVIRRALLALDVQVAWAGAYNAHLAALLLVAAERLGG